MELFGHNEQVYFKKKGISIWRDEHLAIKYEGRSFLLWDCVTASGIGKSVQVDGRIDYSKYQKVILEYQKGVLLSTDYGV